MIISADPLHELAPRAVDIQGYPHLACGLCGQDQTEYQSEDQRLGQHRQTEHQKQ
jgi:hypothetical protein